MSEEDTSKVALVGLGMVSGTYVDALKNMGEDAELIGVLSSRPESASNFLQKHFANSDKAKPIIYDNAAAIAADDAVDFVLLTTPPDARKEFIKLFAKAGKPVLMEKPIERSLAAATELCEICESNNVPLGIMLQHRARPSAHALRKLVDEGNTGALRAVEISVPWWREQRYYDQPGRGSYARDGGGVMISQAIHTLDLALQFTGPVEDVVALTATTEFHEMEAEDFVSAGLRFTSGAVGSVLGSTASYPGRTEEIILHYEQVSATLKSSLLILDWHNGTDWHRFMIENFRSALLEGADLLAPARSALGVHALISALEESGRTGQRATVTSTL